MGKFILVPLMILLKTLSSSCFFIQNNILKKKSSHNFLSQNQLKCNIHPSLSAVSLPKFEYFKVDSRETRDQYFNHDHNNMHEEKLKEFEVEQKFVIPTSSDVTSIENKLKDFGFQKHKTHTFTDWYFDLPSPRWCLTPDDVWLRYRKEKKKSGVWQLKRRPVNNFNKYEFKSTSVYEELEGDDALQTTLDILSKNLYADSSKIISKEELCRQWGTNTIPHDEKLKDTNLVPFARFETIRNSWISTDTKQYSNLKVDIDGTDFGFMVGEVEMMVNDEHRIEDASNTISTFIRNVLSCSGKEDDSYYKTSKLEMYLRTKYPEHYIRLLTCGVL